MASSPPPPTEDADRLRDDDPEAALRMYASLDPRTVVSDGERVSWIVAHAPRIPTPRQLSLFEAIAAAGTDPDHRAAQHLVGVIHWYAGETDAAQEAWRRTLDDSRPFRDRIWVRAHNNLALAFSAHGNYFEALVLFGCAARLARANDERASLVYAHARRGQMFALMGDPSRARREFGWAEALLPSIPDPKEREFTTSTLFATRSRLARMEHDWEALLALQEARIEGLRDLPEDQHATLVNAIIKRALALAHLRPEQLPGLVAEVAAIPDRFQLHGRWLADWRRDLRGLRLAAARARGEGPEVLRDRASEWADGVISTLRGIELIDELTELASLADEIGAEDLARRCLDRAATEALRGHGHAAALHRDLPELADATDEDWQVLDEYRERLRSTRGELLRLVTELWKPGHPTFDAVVHLDQLRACAWCRRIKTNDGTWIPMGEYLPEDPAIEMTHSICLDCRERHFPELPPAEPS